jgi:type I restriction enzyme, S subunit
VKKPPSGWSSLKLDELGFVGRGKSKHRPRNAPFLYGGPYPFIQTGDVKATDLYITDYTQTYSEQGLAQSKLWQPNTLCITIAANIAETAILRIEACFPDSIVGFVADPEKSDVRFIKYYIDTLKLRMQNISRGTTQDNLSLDKLLSFDFVVPALPTQRRIASILSAYDDLIENNTRRIKLLEQMAQAIYREWFVEFRAPDVKLRKATPEEAEVFRKEEVPQGWNLVKVEDLVERVPSGKKYDTNTVSSTGNVPVLDQGRSGIIGYHDDEPGVMASEDDPIIVFANHTCYQRIVQFPFSAIQNVLPFSPASRNHRNIYWLHWATKDLVKFNDYKGHWPEFMSKRLLLPPADLCDEFGQIVKSMVQQIYKLDLKNANLRQTRHLLLPRLVGGEIPVGP